MADELSGTRRFKYHVLPPTGPMNPLAQPGELAFYPTNSIPEGWLAADGSWYQPTDQPALFQAIGYRFGKDGSGRFKIYEMIDFIQPCSPSLGETPFVTMADGVRSHSHGGGQLYSAGGHNHFLTFPDWFDYPEPFHYEPWDGGLNMTCGYPRGSFSFNSSGGHSHSVSASGGGSAETAPKHTPMTLCICAQGDGLGSIARQK